MADEDAVAEAADTLYSAAVDEFMAVRTQLARAAKDAGDAATAKAVTALRKPTVAASIVNRFALADPDSVQRLTELGDRLRTAQENLEASTLRELSAQRRTTVAEIVRAALAHADQRSPATGLRDEVSATFDAAVADPDVARRLGRLVRSESFSGFGVVPAGPGLTLVHGGKASRKSAPKAEPEPEPEPRPRTPSASERRLARRRDEAQADFDTADERFTAAEAAQERGSERVRTLTDELAQLQRELDDAKRALESARREARTARGRRRDARAALDRAERAADRGTS